eukprot:TRINITY_DN1457_c0_g3_i1.p1 TRINITY_DN1457_c0_g3~~TRINITY_DN1457_c0_g3_i1.p1  ORF type:complete len:339 (-),score=32.85 TRINITY_DN1457_c0_g3_i1:709-1725(-)
MYYFTYHILLLSIICHTLQAIGGGPPIHNKYHTAYAYCTDSIYATEDFRDKTQQISQDLGVAGEMLMVIMDLESGIDPTFKSGGRSGLIGLDDITATIFMQELKPGDPRELSELSAMEQLDFVKRKLQGQEGSPTVLEVGQVYLRAIYPIGADGNTIDPPQERTDIVFVNTAGNVHWRGYLNTEENDFITVAEIFQAAEEQLFEKGHDCYEEEEEEEEEEQDAPQASQASRNTNQQHEEENVQEDPPQPVCGQMSLEPLWEPLYIYSQPDEFGGVITILPVNSYVDVECRQSGNSEWYDLFVPELSYFLRVCVDGQRGFVLETDFYAQSGLRSTPRNC